MAKQGKRVSANELAEILGVNRHTVVEWAQKRNCPSVEAADKDAGKSWVFDVAEVVAWRESQAAEAVAEQVGGLISKEEAQRRRAIALASMDELRLSELKKEVVRIEDVARTVTTEYALVRSSLMNIPAKIAPRVALLDNPAEIQAEIEKVINEALAALKADTNANAGNHAVPV